MSKVTKDQYIKDLEHDMDTLGSMVIELREENTGLKKQLSDLVERVPSKYLVVDKNQPSLFDDDSQRELFESK